jgi:hypothetical protein
MPVASVGFDWERMPNEGYVGHGGRLPARVRAFIDFLVAEIDLDAAPVPIDTI